MPHFKQESGNRKSGWDPEQAAEVIKGRVRRTGEAACKESGVSVLREDERAGFQGPNAQGWSVQKAQR